MKKKKILIADDDENANTLMRKGFEKRGYEVMTAKDGAECLLIYEEFLPDLVLIDFMMPRLDGLAVLKKLRIEKKRGQLPILMITSKGKKELVREAVKHGVNDFITKPAKVQEIVDRVSKHLFEVNKHNLREILKTLHFPDPSILSSEIQLSLRNQQLVAYPVLFENLKLCVITKDELNLQLLASASETELEKEVTVMAKAGFIWNAIWPDRVYAVDTPKNDAKTLLNNEDEWLTYVA